MSVDHHKKPFSQETIAKLEIFEDYARAWLPTFVMVGHTRVAIFDLFAGQGYDSDGVPGSAIRLLETVKSQIGNILTRGVKVELRLNEYKRYKYDLLKKACDQYLAENPDVARAVELHITNLDFAESFQRLSPSFGKTPSLVLLDQSGIKAVGQEYFAEFAKKAYTDFLYFVSSSYFWRFGDKEEFKTYLDLNLEEARQNPYASIHRQILDKIKEALPSGSPLMLYPFSIKKGANINGIIFGATHVAAVDKFLRIAWNRNATNGEANFDIHDDAGKTQPDLWGNKPLTKIELFQRDFRKGVLDGIIVTNEDALKYAYSRGHVGTHAADELKKMKSEDLISFEGNSPLVTYEKVFKSGSR
ncbi:MAG: three-Cys-motif partner protein TcmP, partial [Pyrinomonadaceae bacterium]